MTNTQSPLRHMHHTVHVMIYSLGGGSAFVQMCVSLNACPQKDKNHWPVLHSAHRHWHALHQAKESLFSTPPARLCLKTSASLLHLLQSHLSKAKETETEIRRGEVAPCVPAFPALLKSRIPSEDVWNSFPVDKVAPVGPGWMWYLCLGWNKQIQSRILKFLMFNCEARYVFMNMSSGSFPTTTCDIVWCQQVR